MTYDPDQERDESGRWSSGGGGGTPVSVASMRSSAPGPSGSGIGPILTKYDTPEVLVARANAALVAPTSDIKTPEREALRNEIVDKLYGTGGVKEKEAWMIIGGPGSGKSEIGEPLAKERGALVIDPDEAKALLPEYSGGAGAGVVHEESSDLAGRVFDRALENGDNMVIPMVGRNVGRATAMTDVLKAAGYRVNLAYVDVDPKIATQRAIDRFNKTGRFVDPNYIINQVGTKPRETYYALKGHSSVDTFVRYDNNSTSRNYRVVERGAKGAAAGAGHRRRGRAA